MIQTTHCKRFDNYCYHHRDLFFGPSVHIFSFHVWSFTFMLQSDLNKTISFVVGVLSTSFAHALLGLIHYSLSSHMQ